MHGLAAQMAHQSYREARGLILLDTCFLIDLADKRQLHTLHEARLGITSFNLEELEHVTKRMKTHVKEELRHFFKEHQEVTIVDVPVHPGDREGEHAFISAIDDSLLQKIHDPSDAVLIAAAIATNSNVLTKDKHHLFTVQLENYLHAYDIHVWKEWKEREKREKVFSSAN